MRILAVTNMYPSAATPRAGTFIEQQVEGLRRLGHEVGVVLIDRAAAGPHHYLSTGPRVRKAAAGGEWDVVHVMYGGVLADRATLVLDSMPTVVSFCGVDLLGADYGSLWYQGRTAIGVRASRRAAGRADAIVVKSRNLERGLPGSVSRRRVTILPNGVCMERFRPLDRHRCLEKLGWDPAGFHVLFSTANRRSLKKRYRLAEEVIAEVRRRGLAAELHGLSNLPHTEVPVWINAADVLLFTSMADEGSPNIVKECLACNRPVVSVDSGDVAERIDGISGCHLVAADTSVLADALVEVSRGPTVVASRETMTDLSLEAVAKRLVKVYLEAKSEAMRRVGGG